MSLSLELPLRAFEVPVMELIRGLVPPLLPVEPNRVQYSFICEQTLVARFTSTVCRCTRVSSPAVGFHCLRDVRARSS